jgi:hypothetical protein
MIVAWQREFLVEKNMHEFSLSQIAEFQGSEKDQVSSAEA